MSSLENLQAHLLALFQAASVVYSGYVATSQTTTGADVLRLTCNAVGTALQGVPFVGAVTAMIKDTVAYVLRRGVTLLMWLRSHCLPTAPARLRHACTKFDCRGSRSCSPRPARGTTSSAGCRRS